MPEQQRIPPTIELLKRILALPPAAASTTQRMVLTAYAYHADRQFLSRPSHRTVSAETGLSRRAVSQAVSELSSAGCGLMTPAGWHSRVRVWRLTIPPCGNEVRTSPPEGRDMGTTCIGGGNHVRRIVGTTFPQTFS